MAKLFNNEGFSLAETLIALGILAVGMLFIAGAFPVAIQLITVSAERATAAVVAEEAFAKVQLYGSKGVIDYSALQNLKDFNEPSFFSSSRPDIGKYEFTYPSTGSSNAAISQKQYCWSALCRLTRPYNATDPNQPVLVTVFVCRKAGRASKFHEANGGTNGDRPVPVKIINISQGSSNNQLRLPLADRNFVNDDYTIINDATGQIYRVVRRLPVPNDDRIQLDRDWQGSINDIWVVPPVVGGGRNPCIAVYQKEILF